MSVICIVTSIGLQKRAWWMWYLGWVFMFLLAAGMGAVFLSGMAKAADSKQVLNGFIYLGVGLSVWVPVAVWWANNRRRFGLGKRSEPRKRVGGNPAMPPEE
jgi:hypothetical protein